MKIQISIVPDDETLESATETQTLPEMMLLELEQVVLLSKNIGNSRTTVVSVIPGLISVGIDAVLGRYHANALKGNLSLIKS